MWRILLIACCIGLIGNKGKAEEAIDKVEENSFGTEISASPDPQQQEIAQQKDQLLGLLAQVDEKYGDVAATLKNIEQQIKLATGSLDRLRKETATYQLQIDKLDKELSGQVKAAYAMGQQDKLKLMLNQQDPALSSRMMVYYEYLNKSRMEKLGNLQQMVKYLDRLDEEKRAEAELLENNLGQKKREQAALDSARKERDALIAKLNDDFQDEKNQLRLLKDSENKLISLISRLEHEESETKQETEDESTSEDEETQVSIDSFPRLSGDFSTLKGKLPLPVHGKLTGMTGTSSSETNWKGILINAKEGAEIRAVTKGKVVYAGSLKGYGQLIIIEHDKDFMTLYAFNQSLYKHKGDWVESGDVIASVGQSGGRSKPGLYFEIRQNGKPVSPLLWCRN